MAKGRERHEQHQQALASLGRNLSRRARNACELCETRASLRVVEVAGNPEPEVDEDWAVLVCERCAGLIGGGQEDPNTLRFLETTMWSECPAVQLSAVRLLRGLDVVWARQALEGLYLDPELEERL